MQMFVCNMEADEPKQPKRRKSALNTEIDTIISGMEVRMEQQDQQVEEQLEEQTYHHDEVMQGFHSISSAIDRLAAAILEQRK